MQYVIFDDNKSDNFYPLTLNRSIGDLRVGVLKLRQRIAAYFETDEYCLIVKQKLGELFRERQRERVVNHLKENEYCLINSRLIVNDQLVSDIRELPFNSCFINNGSIIAARLKLEESEYCSETILEKLAGLKQIELKSAELWEYPWELIEKNAAYINSDFEDFFYDQDNYYETELGVTVLNPYNVWLGEGTVIKPGVVIDASEGAVIVDENVTIQSNSVITGPVYIGKGTVVKVGSYIYGGTSIGKVCKVGGEIEGSIIHAYTNKQHSGFLGHSYLGEWINIGADTNNSDLKNNYHCVKAFYQPDKTIIDTKKQFLGTIIGDHTKVGINCSINTGAVIGVGCNLYGSQLIDKHIPSFSWGEAGGLSQYRFEAFIETAKIVKKRRTIEITETETSLLKDIADSEVSKS